MKTEYPNQRLHKSCLAATQGATASTADAGAMTSNTDERSAAAVSLSGIPKQDYIVSKLLDRTVVAKGNCKLHRAVYDRLTQVLNELVRIENGADVDEELLDRISMIAGLIDSLYSKATA